MKRATLATVLTIPTLAMTGATISAVAAVPAAASVPVHGPYLLSSPFDNTCGEQEGQILGSFTATAPPANQDGSYDVQIKISATFVTLAGPSFNACNSSTGINGGRTIREGVSGSYVSSALVHLTSATYTGTTTCPRSDTGACDLIGYLHSAYGAGVQFTQTSVHAVLHSNAPRLIRRQAVADCSGAVCASGHPKVTGDIASAG